MVFTPYTVRLPVSMVLIPEEAPPSLQQFVVIFLRFGVLERKIRSERGHTMNRVLKNYDTGFGRH